MKLNDERICYRAFKDRVYISTTWFKDYMFEGVSANIFNCLIKGMEKNDIISLLKQRYDVELKILIKDVNIFINELINYNILLDDSHIKQNHYITSKNKTKDVSYSNLLDISKNDEIPIKIDYHITYKCNQKCKHCYAADNIYANKSGAYDTLMANLNIIDNLKIRCFSVVIIFNMTALNCNEYYKIKSFCIKHDFYLFVNPIIYPNVYNNKVLKIGQKVENISSLIKKGEVNYMKTICTGGKSKCWIDYNGSASLCEFMRESIGNLNKESFMDIWSRFLNVNFDEKQFLPEECLNCNFFKYCAICPGLLESKNQICSITKEVYNNGEKNTFDL